MLQLKSRPYSVKTIYYAGSTQNATILVNDEIILSKLGVEDLFLSPF